MTVARLAVSFDPELAREIKRAAGKQSVSAWLAEAARSRLRSEGLLKVVAEWEAEHGEITEAEMRAIDRKVARARRRP
jgi:hypothetical protein